MSAKKSLRKISAKMDSYKEGYHKASQFYEALNPARIGSHLPSNEEEYNTARHQNEICDDTRRRGAGEIKGGGLVLRPGGMGAYREFHDLYTREPEKEVQKKGINLHEAAKTARYTGPQVRVIAFPDTFCILCMGEVKPGRAGCNGGNKFFPDCKCCPMYDITMVDHAIGNGRIMPGDQIRSVICPKCKCMITAQQKQGQETGLRVHTDGRDIPAWVLKQRAIYESLTRNWLEILHNARLEPVEGKQGVRVKGVGGA